MVYILYIEAMRTLQVGSLQYQYQSLIPGHHPHHPPSFYAATSPPGCHRCILLGMGNVFPDTRRHVCCVKLAYVWP